MIFWQILLVLAIAVLVTVSFFALWGLFTDRPRPAFWGRISSASYWNVVAFSFCLVLISSAVVIALQHSDDQQIEERETLRRVAEAQKQIYKRQGSYGLEADVIAIDPGLYRQNFTIENGQDLRVSYISTSRCQLLLLGKEQKGPTCGQPEQ